MASNGVERPEARTVDDAYLLCTVTHFHALKLVGRFPGRNGYRILKWRCVNCKTYRTDVYDSRGRRAEHPHYDRPSDYPEVKPDREDAVTELIRRTPVAARDERA